jgi:hypothetical protein
MQVPGGHDFLSVEVCSHLGHSGTPWKEGLLLRVVGATVSTTRVVLLYALRVFYVLKPPHRGRANVSPRDQISRS